MSEFKVESLTFSTHTPSTLQDSNWEDIQELLDEAFSEALPSRTSKEVEVLLGLNIWKTFISGRLEPNLMVGNRLRTNQEYAKPLIATAYDSKTLIGYAYTASNVSGNWAARKAKLAEPDQSHNYVWFKEMAVKPDVQQRGIARLMGGMLLLRRVATQPVSAFSFEEFPTIGSTLVKNGFEPMSEEPEPVFAFGEDTVPAQQKGYVFRTAGKLLQRLAIAEQRA